MHKTEYENTARSLHCPDGLGQFTKEHVKQEVQQEASGDAPGDDNTRPELVLHRKIDENRDSKRNAACGGREVDARHAVDAAPPAVRTGLTPSTHRAAERLLQGGESFLMTMRAFVFHLLTPF